ncbi:hypothetical protein HGI30_04570 [Paenibacillus albicereus]|uniref:Uncharacterized protein n=1 Tax=Paenibacillus albicereus TaxID=2726185 RepID=A0A6H2GTZ5_9BACL|nr:hypothetical protein [Paenibacillus albicereus]QJC50904.1 hypothetical protein HGI30_04570 [Paenibacillus albicereus]
MKQTNLIFSYLFIILGICILTISKNAEQLFIQKSFHDVDLSLNYWVGAITILAGSVSLVFNSKFYEGYLKEVELRDREFEEKNKVERKV